MYELSFVSEFLISLLGDFSLHHINNRLELAVTVVLENLDLRNLSVRGTYLSELKICR